MQLTVIALLNSTQAGATPAAEGLEAEAALPEGLSIDSSFTPVAIPYPDAAVGGFDANEAGSAVGYAVRATIEVADDTAPPEQIGNVQIFADAQLDEFLTCPSSVAIGDAAAVATNLDVATLASKGLTGSGIAIAIVDTGINLDFLSNALGRTPVLDAANSWTPPGATTLPGEWPVAHATMCAFDALIAAPDATLLDVPVLRATGTGPGLSGWLSTALQAYGQIHALWTSGNSPYCAIVMNNSWGIVNYASDFPPGHTGRFIDNPRHPFNVLMDTMAAVGVDVLFAAGNCGSECPAGNCTATSGTIVGANAMQSVLTIAGCDNNGDRVGYSSQGPSIAGMYQQKPDVTAYTHFSGSGVYAPRPDNGTSAACPVAAGCVAAIRTNLSPTTAATPAQLFDQFRATAARANQVSTSWSADDGWGIINPVAVANAFGL